jgi:hypothetical protein
MSPEAEARRAKQRERHLAAFRNSLPVVYRDFYIRCAPNPALCEYLLKFWRTCAVGPDGNDLPEAFGDGNPTGLLLFGPPRSGKTQIACELTRQRIKDPEDYADARFIAAVQWGCETSRRAKDCELDKWVTDQIGFAWRNDLDCAYLVIDDIDKTKFTPTVESQLFNLIESATSNEIVLLVTTNCTAAALVNRFSDRAIAKAIVGRLQEFCKPVNMGIHMEGKA